MKSAVKFPEGGFAPLPTVVARLGACSIAGVLLVALQLGSGTPLQRSLDQINRSVTRPVPQAPPPSSVWRPSQVWIPDRFVSDPVDGRMVHVPGHWERVLPSGELYAPPVTICGSTGVCTTIPAGVRPPLEQQRQAP